MIEIIIHTPIRLSVSSFHFSCKMVANSTEDGIEKTIRSVETAFDIVEIIFQQDYPNLSEIATHLDIAVSTAHAHLNTLRKCEVVIKRDDGTYRLSSRFLEFGGALRQRSKLYRVAQTQIDHIAQQIGETVGLAIEERDWRVLVYKSEVGKALGDNIPIGEHTHLHWSSLGKAILAYLPRQRVHQIIDRHGLPRSSEYTITDRDELLAELDWIQQQGYALDDEERHIGVRGMAVALQTPDENVLGSIGVAGPKQRFNEAHVNELIGPLQNVANQIIVEYEYY